MRMPVMDGLEAARQIRRQEAQTGASPTKIIAITAAVFEEERASILAAGCDAVVSKPASESVVLQTLVEQLGVHYVYEEPQTQRAQVEQSVNAIALVRERLRMMPLAWQVQLNRAARSANESVIFELVNAMPDAEWALREAIAHLVDTFQLEVLIHLTPHAYESDESE